MRVGCHSTPSPRRKGTANSAVGSGDKTQIMLVACISAAGYCLPPTICVITKVIILSVICVHPHITNVSYVCHVLCTDGDVKLVHMYYICCMIETCIFVHEHRMLTQSGHMRSSSHYRCLSCVVYIIGDVKLVHMYYNVICCMIETCEICIFVHEHRMLTQSEISYRDPQKTDGTYTCQSF